MTDEWIAYRGAAALIGARRRSLARADDGQDQEPRAPRLSRGGGHSSQPLGRMDLHADLQGAVVGEDAGARLGSCRRGRSKCGSVPGSAKSAFCVRDVERLAAAVIEPDRRPRAGASLPAKELLEAAAARVLREKFSEQTVRHGRGIVHHGDAGAGAQNRRLEKNYRTRDAPRLVSAAPK